MSNGDVVEFNNSIEIVLLNQQVKNIFILLKEQCSLNILSMHSPSVVVDQFKPQRVFNKEV